MTTVEKIDARLVKAGWARRQNGDRSLFETDNATLHFVVTFNPEYPKLVYFEVGTRTDISTASQLAFDLEHRSRIDAFLDHVMELVEQMSAENWKAPLAAFQKRWDAHVHASLRWSKHDLREPDHPPWNPGVKVTHAKFGVGTVTSVIATGTEVKLDIKFDSGNRILLAKFVTRTS